MAVRPIISAVKWVILIVIAIVIIAVTVRTIDFSKPVSTVKGCKPTDADFIPLNEKRLSHFQEALGFKTISWEVGKYDSEELQKFGDFIINEFPTIHKNSSHVEWERVNKYSLLYHVKGSNPSLKPYLLMSHLDVVPVSNPEVWEVPAFSGKVHDGFIYGRGALDVKQTAMGILEALEYLLIHNKRPERSFFVAFGHDEEVMGQDGAAFLSQRMKEKGVKKLEYILDEGMPITSGIIAGVDKPLASVGVVEKGFAVLKLSVKGVPGHSSIPQKESTISILARAVDSIGVVEKGQAILKLSVKGAPGHSSMPQKESTISILAKAVERLQSNPPPSMLGKGAEKDMFEAIAREVNIFQRILLANIWLFKPVISWFLSMKPTTNALIRTVTSVTMFNAGVKVNVLPPYAEAMVNHRIHPAQSVNEIIEYDRQIIGDDRVNIDVVSYFEPHPTAGYGDNDFGFQALKTSIKQIWVDTVVGPGVMVGNTDTKHYLDFTQNVYRFSPTFMVPGDPERFHGNNERISVKNYEQVINFYYHLMRNSDQAGVSPIHKPHEEF